MKLYSTSELAEMGNMTTMGVSHRARKAGISASHFIVKKNNKASVKEKCYTEEEAQKMGLIASKNPNKKQPLSLEELKALHPLVKDENFFKLSYFPDVRLEVAE